MESFICRHLVSSRGPDRSYRFPVFDGVEDCFLALVGELAKRIVSVCSEAFAGEGPLSERVIAALEALLKLLDAEPSLAHAGLIEAAPFLSLLPELATIVVFPFLGDIEAKRAAEASVRRAGTVEVPISRLQRSSRHALPKQLSRANAHHARAALRYIAEHSGVSNKQVGRAIGVEHVAQISALLARLEQAGLLIKKPRGAGKPNAWRTSPDGELVAMQIGLT